MLKRTAIKLFYTAAVLSVVLWFGAVGLWGYGWLRVGKTIAVGTEKISSTRMTITGAGVTDGAMEVSLSIADISPDKSKYLGTTDWLYDYFEIDATPYSTGSSGRWLVKRGRLRARYFGRLSTLSTIQNSYAIETMVSVPVWSLVIVLGILPGVATKVYVDRRNRLLAGRCRRCRYDLRATPDRCPECGTLPIESSTGRSPGLMEFSYLPTSVLVS